MLYAYSMTTQKTTLQLFFFHHQVPVVTDLKVTVISSPGDVTLEEPFQITCLVTNTRWGAVFTSVGHICCMFQSTTNETTLHAGTESWCRCAVEWSYWTGIYRQCMLCIFKRILGYHLVYIKPLDFNPK